MLPQREGLEPCRVNSSTVKFIFIYDNSKYSHKIDHIIMLSNVEIMFMQVFTLKFRVFILVV